MGAGYRAAGIDHHHEYCRNRKGGQRARGAEDGGVGDGERDEKHPDELDEILFHVPTP